MGVAIILVIISCTDLSLCFLLTPVQQFHPTCPYTFYNFNSVLFKFLEKLFYGD